MKRLREKNINTSEFHNACWKDGEHHFDNVRMRAFTDYINKDNSVCDLGAGMFGFGQYYLENVGLAKITAVDFSTVARDKVLKRCPAINYIVADIFDNGLPSGMFDVVGSSEVIEHLDEPLKLVEEMNRLTKKGGLMIVGTVDTNCENAKKRDYPDHVFSFTEKELEGFFKPFGTTKFEKVGDYDFVYCIKK
jgi:2-polyprenyl-3-methyl-5-hydroxy-6-metoxy-1,4-benzoquinol methylase